MTGFDWPALLRAGLALGLRPAEFWSLTPAEFVEVCGGTLDAPLTRARLEELTAAFPDTPKE